MKLKKTLRTEPYLEVYHRRGIPELAKLRGGTNRLRIEQGRYRKEALEDRICEFCESKEVENEEHFMLRCKAYHILREIMWKRFSEITGINGTEMGSDEERLNALIGDAYQPSEDSEKNSTKTQNYRQLARIVMTYITTAMKRRRGLQR